MEYTFFHINIKATPESILQQITQIQRMDRGTVIILRQGPQGPYYNEDERNASVKCFVIPAGDLPVLFVLSPSFPQDPFLNMANGLLHVVDTYLTV